LKFINFFGGNLLNRNSLLLVGGIIVLILAGAVASAIIPSLGLSASGSGGGGSVAAPPVEVENIVLDMPKVPAFMPEDTNMADMMPDFLKSEDGTYLEFSPWLGIGFMAAILIGGLVVVTGGIAFLVPRLQKMTTDTLESDDYKEGVKTIQASEKELLKEMNAKSPTFSMKGEDYDQPRWSVISTGALVLLFVTFTAIAISDTFYPEGEMMRASGEVLIAPNVFAGISALITLALMFAFFRPRTLDAINGEEAGAIPWDTIYLLVTGFIFIVGGIGLIIWLRQPIG
jgi:uncharacterized membrane protein